MVKRLVLEKADRLFHLPAHMDGYLPRKTKKKIIGHEIIDLARFNWPASNSDDSHTESLCPASNSDLLAAQEQTAQWYQNRFGVKINPVKEIFIGGSIRQLLILFSLAYLNPNDILLIPDPGIWHYRAATALSSAEPVPYHLTERNRFRPGLSSLSENMIRLSRGLVLNSPHNPTGQILDKDDLGELIHTAGKENLILILDQAFNGFLDDKQSTSIFSIPGGRKVGLELYSYAYNFGRPLPSLGFAVGQPALIASIKEIAAIFGIHISKGQAHLAKTSCLSNCDNSKPLFDKMNKNRKLADQLCDKLRLFTADFRQGPFYWAKLPGRKLSRRFCRLLYLRCGIMALPGLAFGENGEGYIRFSLTAEEESYEKAIESASKLYQKSRKNLHG